MGLRAGLATVGALIIAGTVAAVVVFSLSSESVEPAPAPTTPAVSSPTTETSEPAADPSSPPMGAWFFPIPAGAPLVWTPLGGDVTISLAARSVDTEVGIEFDLLSEIPELPPGYVPIKQPFDLSVQPDHDSGSIPFTFLKPLTMTFRLSGSDTAQAGGVESNLVVQRYHEEGWTLLATTVDFGASTAQVQVDSLSIFALTIKTAEPTPAPEHTPTLAPTPTDTPLPIPKPVPTAIPEPTPTQVPTATAT